MMLKYSSKGNDPVCRNMDYEYCIQRLKCRIQEELQMNTKDGIFIVVEDSNQGSKTMIMMKSVKGDKMNIYRIPKLPSQVTSSDIKSLDEYRFRPFIENIVVEVG